MSRRENMRVVEDVLAQALSADIERGETLKIIRRCVHALCSDVLGNILDGMTYYEIKAWLRSK